MLQTRTTLSHKAISRFPSHKINSRECSMGSKHPFNPDNRLVFFQIPGIGEPTNLDYYLLNTFSLKPRLTTGNKRKKEYCLIHSFLLSFGLLSHLKMVNNSLQYKKQITPSGAYEPMAALISSQSSFSTGSMAP